jgi:hypothetical protein
MGMRDECVKESRFYRSEFYSTLPLREGRSAKRFGEG